MKIVKLHPYGATAVSADEVDSLLKKCAAVNKITIEHCIKLLETRDLQYGIGLRYEPLYCTSQKNYEAFKQRQAQSVAEYVKCDCGHTVPKSQVMGSARGSCCPNCYDRMSD
jgi:hypothetical protein